MQRIDDLFLAFTHRRGLDEVRREVEDKPSLWEVFDLGRILSDLAILEETELAGFAEVYGSLTRDLPLELRRLYFFRYVIAQLVSHRIEPERYGELLETIPRGDRESECLLATVRTAALWSEGRPHEMIPALEDLLAEIRGLERSVPVAYVESMVHHGLGYAYQQTGSFLHAASHFTIANDLASLYDFYTKWIYRSALAKLNWASGQYRRALELHCDPEARSAAQAVGDAQFLADSHLCAAKCAIDMRATDKASAELNEAQRILEDHSGQFPELEPYLTLFSAELDQIWGNTDEAEHLLERAVELFEGLGPHGLAGALDAKLDLVELALRRQNYRVVFRRLAELLEEAEARGCVTARTRLLAFRAHLYLEKDVPLELLESGYDDLVHRMHLMNNPRLTFLAYADLFSFAREHLDTREQKFWLQRIKRLEALLEKSCYDDLYRTHVTERYRTELESRLERFERELDRLAEPDDRAGDD